MYSAALVWWSSYIIIPRAPEGLDLKVKAGLIGLGTSFGAFNFNPMPEMARTREDEIWKRWEEDTGDDCGNDGDDGDCYKKGLAVRRKYSKCDRGYIEDKWPTQSICFCKSRIFPPWQLFTRVGIFSEEFGGNCHFPVAATQYICLWMLIAFCVCLQCFF